MRRNTKLVASVTLMIVYWVSLSYSKYTNEFSTLTLISTMGMGLKRPFIPQIGS